MKILKQETDKSCGVACLRSILNHYGNNFSEKDIWDKHESYFPKPDNMLNPILNLGIAALKFGFDVKYLNYHPILANGNSKKTLEESLKEKSKNYFEFGKYYVDKGLEFLEKGGEIIFDKLNAEKIKSILEEGNFPMIQIKPAFINKNANINMNHKVIVSGYTEKGFKILNPSDAKEYFWDFDIFYLAFYSSIPEMLIITPKNKK
jgi:hypothetical protein